MDAEELESIRSTMGISTQQEMAHLLQCDYIGYKRWASGARDIPRYIERSVRMLLFIFQCGKLDRFKISIEKAKTAID
jgi:hypothetical protein